MLKLHAEKKGLGSLTHITNTLINKYQYSLGEFTEENLTIENIVRHLVNYYEDIIHCMPYNVYWLDKDCRGVGCNKNVLSMFGLKSYAEFRGLGFEEMARIGKWSDTAKNSFKKDTLEVLESGKAKLNIEEPPIPDVDGRMIYFLTSRVPLFSYSGEVISIVGISIDITNIKESEKQLKIAKEAAEQANKLKTEFIQNMQHDIRTPLTGLYSFLNTMTLAQKKDECLALLPQALKATHGLLELCNEVIDFENVEYGEKPILSKRFNLYDLLHQVIELHWASAHSKGLMLNLIIDKKLPPFIKGDDYRLKKIIINLCSNAIKFTQSGTILLIAKLEKAMGNDLIIQFDINDTGIGIPANKKEIIYEKFIRLHPSNQGKYKGTGLGLSIVKRFVEELNGDIDIESELGKGTSFHITLPFKKPLIESMPHHQDLTDEEVDSVKYLLANSSTLDTHTFYVAQGNTAKTILHKTKKEPLQPKKMILLIEDDALARFAEKMILEELGCEVVTAEDVTTAKETLDKYKFDLVVSDIGLPDGNGFDIVKYTKKDINSLNFKVPFIALTAHSNSKINQIAEESGFLAFLQKPLNSEKTQRVLDAYLYGNKNTSAQEEIKDPIPVIDLKLGKLLANGNEKLSFELLDLFAQNIENDKQLIEKAYKDNDIKITREILHKLKGRLCYCGLPILQRSVNNLHDKVRTASQLTELNKLYKIFYQEIGNFLVEYDTLKKES